MRVSPKLALIQSKQLRNGEIFVNVRREGSNNFKEKNWALGSG